MIDRAALSRLLLALSLAPACGDSGGRESDSATGASSPTTPITITPTDPNPTTAGPDPTTDGGATVGVSATGTGDDSSGPPTASDGPKFDQGAQPDFGGNQGCNGGGGEPDTMFSYIWIANSSENTVSKINTKSGVEEGRYAVVGGSPSRTSVNLQGDVAVSSRDPGGVTKIAAQLERCVDANADGVITTSTGPADVKPYGTDECVLWTKPIESPGYTYGPRATAWEGVKPDPVTCIVPTPRLWFAWMDGANTAHFVRVDGATGATLDEVLYPNWGPGYSPYGGAVNANGDFFATGLNTQPAVKIDAATLAVTELGIPNGCKYGMSLDADGNIWVGGCIGGHVYYRDALTNTWVDMGVAGGDRVNGIMADREGNVWGAGSSPCRLVHVDAKAKSFVNTNIPVPGCGDPWGVSIDVDGYVWLVDMTANQAFKIDPETYQLSLTVTGLVGPYTYSDMTGAGLNLQVNPPG